MSFDTDKEDWGTICDLWPVASAWASTLCHELGYSHAAIAEKVSSFYFVLNHLSFFQHFFGISPAFSDLPDVTDEYIELSVLSDNIYLVCT